MAPSCVMVWFFVFSISLLSNIEHIFATLTEGNVASQWPLQERIMSLRPYIYGRNAVKSSRAFGSHCSAQRRHPWGPIRKRKRGKKGGIRTRLRRRIDSIQHYHQSLQVMYNPFATNWMNCLQTQSILMNTETVAWCVSAKHGLKTLTLIQMLMASSVNVWIDPPSPESYLAEVCIYINQRWCNNIVFNDAIVLFTWCWIYYCGT